MGPDLVHYDHHRSNVLVAPDDPDRVVAIVDWGGARGGSVDFDLVCLAADLERWCHPRLAARIDRELEATVAADRLRSFRAHTALRYVDWMLRHSPQHLDGWLVIAERYVADG
jgi:Ser/Thr protein kinase RdoA (MazF antagonist)